MFDYTSKQITVEQALDKVQSRQVLALGMAGGEPREFLTRLHTIAHRVEDVIVTSGLVGVGAKYLSEQYLEKAFIIHSFFYSKALRRLHKTGRVNFVPNHLHAFASRRIFSTHTNIFIASASMPDENGRVRLSGGNIYEKDMALAAEMVILEISPNIPTLLGDNYLEWDQIDHVVACNYGLPVLPDAPSNEKDRAIGGHISDLIQDGDCIQIGIGGIPNAVCEYLADKKDLGIHTEMMTTGMMKLMKQGVVTGAKKQLHPGKAVCGFALGSAELYAFVDNNPDVLMMNGAWVNNPAIIAQNDNQVSVNTTLEVDLSGQCCSESIGARQFSGTGGQADTAIGAQYSKNGRSFIALYSTAMVPDGDSGEKKEISKIVPTLRCGATVSLSRNDVDYVVTEYGVVNLRGATLCERAERLISIAHPRFREALRQAAAELEIWM